MYCRNVWCGLLDQCGQNGTVPDHRIITGTGTGTAIPQIEPQDREEQGKDRADDIMSLKENQAAAKQTFGFLGSLANE